MDPQPPPMIQVWAKVPVEWREKLQKLASDQALDLSDIVRTALRQFLAGGAERWSVAEAARIAAENALSEQDQRDLELGRYVREGLNLEAASLIAEFLSTLARGPRSTPGGSAETPGKARGKKSAPGKGGTGVRGAGLRQVERET